MAEQGGFDEEHVAKIASVYEDSDLSEREKILLRYADSFLTTPPSMDAAVERDVRREFSDAEIVEITTALALFLGFSKIAIALGPVPDGIPVMQLALPDLPDASAG